MGNKRDSFVRLNIRGVVSHKISTFQLLVAGDTIVNFEDINIQAFERVGGKQEKNYVQELLITDRILC